MGAYILRRLLLVIPTPLLRSATAAVGKVDRHGGVAVKHFFLFSDCLVYGTVWFPKPFQRNPLR